MNKWAGIIGFANSVEVRKGFFKDEIIEKQFYGDVIRNTRRWEKGESANDDLNIYNQISILADSFAINNIHKMKYVELYGAFWKITAAEIQTPRLILTIGGVWNGQTASASK